MRNLKTLHQLAQTFRWAEMTYAEKYAYTEALVNNRIFSPPKQYGPKAKPKKKNPTVFTGERGGRYYKRTRADGTTYRDYTW